MVGHEWCHVQAGTVAASWEEGESEVALWWAMNGVMCRQAQWLLAGRRRVR